MVSRCCGSEIVESEYSECCGSKLVGNSDICSDCKEHCGDYYVCGECGCECDEIEDYEWDEIQRENHLEMMADARRDEY